MKKRKYHKKSEYTSFGQAILHPPPMDIEFNEIIDSIYDELQRHWMTISKPKIKQFIVDNARPSEEAKRVAKGHLKSELYG